MNVGGRNGRVPGADRDLVKVGDNIADGVEAGHRGLEMLVDDKAPDFRTKGAEPYREVGSVPRSPGRDIKDRNAIPHLGG